ncbi:MAG TPA: NAD(P)/FAD-dependent oxidoreductase [Gemmatimonadales bacterium]|nr:NAD(P)/FAD-dependent oxidoreductase [Gemmatimonadales bacterium]
MSAARWGGDAIVIGADVNGLVAAHYLARAGRRVLVLEAGQKADTRPDSGWVPPQLVRELGLTGVRIEQPDPWISAPLDGGERLDLSRDVAKSALAIRRLSNADAAKWPEFCTRMRRLASVLEALYVQPAPDVETREIGELLRMASLGLRVRRLGKQTVIDLLRILPMSIAELLDDWFENDTLKGILGAAGVWHLRQGPRAGGTAFNFLHHHVGSAAGVFRPPRSNISQILTALPGVELRRGVTATVAATSGRATGVRVGGEELSTPLVVSSLDPWTTFEPLQAQLDAEFVRAVRNIKSRSIVVRGTATPARPADYTALCVAPSLDHLERAHDDAKYGRTSARPYVEAVAADGRLDLHVQYAAATDANLVEKVAAVLGLPAGQVRLEAPGGHLYHGELTLDQILFMRPVPGWSRYRTPIAGLYLCGPGTHPGGGIAGAAGRNAARVILKETS